jgi:ABC-type uncharacterized transport system substrate-binding protein
MCHHRRRQFLWLGLALVGIGLLSAWEAPDLGAARGPRIGFLAIGTRENRTFLIEGLLRGLREHGYVEGKNILVEYRFSEGRNERLPELAAELVALKLQRLAVRVPEDFEGALKAAIGQHADALFVPGDPLVTNRPRVVADLALKYRLPSMTDFRELPENGGLMSFGPDLVDSYRRAATHVDKILKGANPADLPMEQPTKFDLVVNLKTVRALGATVPQSILIQATQIIQ